MLAPEGRMQELLTLSRPMALPFQVWPMGQAATIFLLEVFHLTSVRICLALRPLDLRRISPGMHECTPFIIRVSHITHHINKMV